MNYVAGVSNPDVNVRKHVKTETKLEKLQRKEAECRIRADAAARCGKLHTAQNAIGLAEEYALMIRVLSKR